MKVITAVVNNPTFIRIQHATLQKYFQGDFEFIVFDDSKPFPDFTNGYDISVKTQIQSVCKSLGISCIQIPNDHHRQIQSASIRCADAINFMLQYQLQHPDKYLCLDSDMFLIRPFHPSRYENFKCAVIISKRDTITYLWNGLYYFDIPKLKHLDILNWNMYPGCDTGGMTHKWLSLMLDGSVPPTPEELRYGNNIATSSVLFLHHLWSCTWDLSELPSNLFDSELISFLQSDPRNKDGKFFCELFDDIFLHYRAGGNWRQEGMNLHIQLAKRLETVLTNL